jgi:hypothetical protein
LASLARGAERVWRWPNFSPAEIACRGTGKVLVNEPALDKLQALRDRLGNTSLQDLCEMGDSGGSFCESCFR